MTHGQRKYHHPCIVIPDQCNPAKAACSIDVVRSLLTAPLPLSSVSISQRIYCWLVTYRMYLIALFNFLSGCCQPAQAHIGYALVRNDNRMGMRPKLGHIPNPLAFLPAGAVLDRICK